MKSTKHIYCPCCGYHKRYRAQMRRYREIARNDVCGSAVVGKSSAFVAPLRRPDWKPVGNPRRLDRFIQCAPEHGLLTPLDLKQRHKNRDIRRRNAAKFKRQYQREIFSTTL